MKRSTAAIIVGGALLLATAGTSSAAATTTDIAVLSATPVVAKFAEPWVLELQVTAAGAFFVPAIDETSGTVDVFIDQVPGTFLDDLTVQPDGRVFVTQPPNAAWLAPGTYDLRALFTPVGPTDLNSAQVSVVGAITITPIELIATVDVTTDAAAVTVPTVSLSLSGVGEPELQSAPPGVWKLSVREAESDEVVEIREVVQPTDLDPIVVELADSLRAGRDHVLVSEFIPYEEYLPGVTITGTGEQSFRTSDASFADLVVAPVLLPIWALVLIAIGVMLGAVGLIVTLIARARRAPTEGTDRSDGAEEDAPADDLSAMVK